MPLYLYRCSNCGEDYDVLCKIDDRDQMQGRLCPECNRGKLERVAGNNGGFRLKPGGVGWSEEGYSTHYGDAENFKARSKGLPEPYTSDIGKQ
jgi:putative FmdB family regulatory protein